MITPTMVNWMIMDRNRLLDRREKKIWDPGTQELITAGTAVGKFQASPGPAKLKIEIFFQDNYFHL